MRIHSWIGSERDLLVDDTITGPTYSMSKHLSYTIHIHNNAETNTNLRDLLEGETDSPGRFFLLVKYQRVIIRQSM